MVLWKSAKTIEGTEAERLTIPATSLQQGWRFTELDTLKDFIWNGTNAWNPIGGFLPTDVANLKLWLDADDPTTFSFSSSNLISQWNDKSGQGNNLTQGTVADQPLLIQGVQNGKPIVRFDAIDDFLQRVNFTGGAISQPDTIYFVCKFPSATSSTNGFVFDGDTSRQAVNHDQISTLSNYGMFSPTVLSTTTTVDTINILLYKAVFNDTSSSLDKSQVQQLSGTTGANGLNGIVLGAPFSRADSFSNPDIAEMLFYESIPSTGDDADIISYLRNKWALP